MAASCNQVAMYDLIMQELNLYIWNENEQQEMLVASMVDEQLYVFPRNSMGQVISFSLVNRIFKVEEKWHNFFDKRKEVYRFTYNVQAINNILFCCQGSKILYVYDLSENKLSCLELSVEGVDKIANHKINIVFDIPKDNHYGYAADTGLRLSGEKLRKLGWEAQTGLEQMYRNML